MYYNSDMAMGKRNRDRQPAMWVTMTNLPTAASHPFYRRLNQLLREHAFDDFAEAQCATFYADTMGRRLQSRALDALAFGHRHPARPPGPYNRTRWCSARCGASCTRQSRRSGLRQTV
jgi:hypothetical protein